MVLERCFVADPESHILFFDIEALIIELLSEEYSAMSPNSLEAAGLISSTEYLKVAALTQSASPDAHKKIVGKFSHRVTTSPCSRAFECNFVCLCAR